MISWERSKAEKKLIRQIKLLMWVAGFKMGVCGGVQNELCMSVLHVKTI